MWGFFVSEVCRWAMAFLMRWWGVCGLKKDEVVVVVVVSFAMVFHNQATNHIKKKQD